MVYMTTLTPSGDTTMSGYDTFVPTFSCYSSETAQYAFAIGFITLREAIDHANLFNYPYVIRRSRYIPGYGDNGCFPRGMVVHTQTRV
jgi:hypothetical protein